MPEQVTQRLQAVIAQEAARRSVGATMPAVSEIEPDVGIEPSPAMIPGRPDLPPPRRARQRRVRRPKAWSSPLLLRGLTAATVLVVLVGGGFLLARGRGPVSQRTAAPASTPKSVKRAPSSAVVGSAATTPLRYRHGKQLAYANAVTTSANYTKTSLPAGVRSEVKNSAQVTGPSPATSTSAGNSAPATGHRLSGNVVSRLESCLSAVATGNLVLLVDVAHYLGRPATIIVLKPVNDVFDVIVVGQGCGTSGENVITRLTVPKK
jgi:hypothetical protein